MTLRPLPVSSAKGRTSSAVRESTHAAIIVPGDGRDPVRVVSSVRRHPRACGEPRVALTLPRKPGRPQLNRITCRYLAAAVPGLWHAYSEWTLCGRVANRTAGGLPPSAWRVARAAGGGRKEPPLAGACTECGVLA